MKRILLKGACGQLSVMELWVLLCWMIPIATELLVRRFVPLPVNGEWWLLLGGYTFNRLLVAPAHIGYAACCRKLASPVLENTAATCEIGDLRRVKAEVGLLKVFFSAYAHPVLAFKKQLRWDTLRAVGYLVAAVPGIFLLIAGGVQPNPIQAAFAGCGILLTIALWLLVWVLFRRLQVSLLLDVGLSAAWRSTRKKTEVLLQCYTKMLPLLIVPFSLQRFAMHAHMVVLLQKTVEAPKKKRYLQIFHTRVLGET